MESPEAPSFSSTVLAALKILSLPIVYSVHIPAYFVYMPEKSFWRPGKLLAWTLALETRGATGIYHHHALGDDRLVEGIP
jgi:hypothetical protein